MTGTRLRFRPRTLIVISYLPRNFQSEIQPCRAAIYMA